MPTSDLPTVGNSEEGISEGNPLIVVKYKIMENSHVIDDALLSKSCPVFSEPRLNQNGIKQQWQASCPK